MTESWHPGQPIATGVLHLPTPAVKQAYGQACNQAVIDGMVQHVMAGAGRPERGRRLAKIPERLRATVRQRVISEWSKRKEK